MKLYIQAEAQLNGANDICYSNFHTLQRFPTTENKYFNILESVRVRVI